MTTEMHSAAVALRERMIEDMRVRGFVEKTRANYVRQVRPSLPSLAGRLTRRQRRICVGSS